MRMSFLDIKQYDSFERKTQTAKKINKNGLISDDFFTYWVMRLLDQTRPKFLSESSGNSQRTLLQWTIFDKNSTPRTKYT